MSKILDRWAEFIRLGGDKHALDEIVREAEERVRRECAKAVDDLASHYEGMDAYKVAFELLKQASLRIRSQGETE